MPRARSHMCRRRRASRWPRSPPGSWSGDKLQLSCCYRRQVAHVRARISIPGSRYFVKSPVFPWGKFPGRRYRAGSGDALDRRSHGRRKDNFGEAFAKAQIAAGQLAAGEADSFSERQRSRQGRQSSGSLVNLWKWDFTWLPRTGRAAMCSRSAKACTPSVFTR